LVAGIRLLSLCHGVRETSTVGRIKALLTTGNLGVNLAERLLLTYQVFYRYLLDLEFGQQIDGEFYFNPELLNEESSELFKEGFEDVNTLQRIVYQQMVEAS
jgi:signal-transduction protein with cAMP-binding, CBS, and nucleotidyltransferase domain